MTVECPACKTIFPVDPNKVPSGGVHARCSECSQVFFVEAPPARTLPEVPEAPSPAETTSALQQEAVTIEGHEKPAEPSPESGLAEPPVEEAEAEQPEPLLPDVPVSQPEAPEPEPEPEPWLAEPPVAETEPEWEPAFPEPPVEEPEPESEPAAPEPPVEEAEAEQPEPETGSAEPTFGEPERTFPLDSPSLGAPPPAEPLPEKAPGTPHTGESDAPPAIGPLFQRRDPLEKAQRLARVLVSDIILYNPDRYQIARDSGRVREEFEEEIQKSWTEFVEQVGEEVATTTSFFEEALAEILSGGDEAS